MTELGRKSGVIEENESDLIQRVFDLNDVTAWDIMTPIARVDALEKNRSLQEIKDIVMELTHTRIPVYNGSLDKITGVVHVRDILKALAEDQMDLSVGELSKEASFSNSASAEAFFSRSSAESFARFALFALFARTASMSNSTLSTC